MYAGKKAMHITKLFEHSDLRLYTGLTTKQHLRKINPKKQDKCMLGGVHQLRYFECCEKYTDQTGRNSLTHF
jgi:hypothetical protein